MFDYPETRYLEREGVNIGYQVVRDGPADLFFVPALLSQIDLLSAPPASGRFSVLNSSTEMPRARRHGLAE
jgi:hypothetical protein